MSLRDTIESAVNTVEENQLPPADPVTTESPSPETPKGAEPAQPAGPGRTAGRPRDEKGRLLPGAPDPEAKKAAVSPAAPAPELTLAPAPAPSRKPPSSWKKEMWDHYGKLDPTLQDYIEQREGEFAKGVSTYKQEYESVKPLVEALEPLMPTLRQYNIQPAQWITNMGNAHHSLVFGNPQQKLQMFTKLAQDYGVPLQALYDPQAQQQFLMQQSVQPPAPQPDVRQLVQQELTQVRAEQDLETFKSATGADGKPLHPHFDTVRNTMAQLLEAGAANDLNDAYEKAKRLHDDIWTQEQQAKSDASRAQQEAAAKAAQDAKTRQVAQARSVAVSPRTATPGAEAVKTTKGIRSSVEAAFDAHTGGGRV